MISIHATPMGRDRKFKIHEHIGCISIHATLTGRDVLHPALWYLLHYFNSRDPHGPRSKKVDPEKPPPSNFNSRDPTGRDGNMQRISGLFVISIHATTRAAMVMSPGPLKERKF